MKIDWELVETPPTPQEVEKAEARRLAKAQLNETDFYVTRMTEIGTPIPDEIKALRAACRATLSQE